MNEDTLSEEPAGLLGGMPAAWRAVYDLHREAQALAALEAMERPGDPEAQAVHVASSAAVRAFRRQYERSSTDAIAGQISGGTL